MTTIGFDHSHNNKLTIENNAFNEFIQYLFDSKFKLGKIEAGLTYEKLKKYDLFIIGVPTLGPDLDADEIKDLVNYVKDGGSVLIINDGGGDYENKNNLSQLTQNFGVKFNSDRLYDDKSFLKESSHPIITNFKSHFITRDLTQIIHSNGCTLTIDKSIADDKIDVNIIANSSEKSSWHTYFNGDEWQNKAEQQLPIICAIHYYLGKGVAIGNLSIFSSLSKSYGIKAAENFKMVTNIISWLLNKAGSKEEKSIKPIYTSVAIEQDLFYWIKEMLKKGRWNNLDELINFAVKVIKNKMKETEKYDQN
ncbi:MAG: hypothetical protein ACFFDF_10735 [Candidatus Odinarchaeota archaeon]